MIPTLSLLITLPVALIVSNGLGRRYGAAAAFRLCPPLPVAIALSLRWWAYGDETLAALTVSTIGSAPSVCAFGIAIYFAAVRRMKLWLGTVLAIASSVIVDALQGFVLEPYLGSGAELLVIPLMVWGLALLMRTGKHPSTEIAIHDRCIFAQVATVVVFISMLIVCVGNSSLPAVIFFTLLHSTPRLTMELSMGLWHDGGPESAVSGISQLPFTLSLPVLWCIVANLVLPIAGGAAAVVLAWIAVAIAWTVLFVTRPRITQLSTETLLAPQG